jgi:hypothetical protein
LLAFARDLLNSAYAGHRLSFVQFTQAPHFNHLNAVCNAFDFSGPLEFVRRTAGLFDRVTDGRCPISIGPRSPAAAPQRDYPLPTTAIRRLQAASAAAKSIASPGPANETCRTKSSYSLAHKGSISSRRSMSANTVAGSAAGTLSPPRPTSAAAAASASSEKWGAEPTCR